MITPITFADPNAAIVAGAAGILLIALEFCMPGAVLPAALGGGLSLIAAWSLAQGAVNAGAAATALAALAALCAAGWWTPPLWRWPAAAVAGLFLAYGLSRIAVNIRWQIAAMVATVLSPILVRLLSIAAAAHRNKAIGEMP